MTDVEAKTPNKRKLTPGKQGSQKKAKLDNGQTPQKQKASPKQLQNANKSIKKDKKTNGPGKGSPKKPKAFSGTSEIETPKVKEKPGKKSKLESKDGEQAKRKSQYFKIQDQVKSGDQNVRKEAVASIESRIKEIESRAELTKTAKRKLKLLRRYKNIAEGKTPAKPPTKDPNAKSDSTKRRDRKNKAIAKAEEGKGAKLIKTVKPNQKGKNKNVSPQKKAKLEVNEDESDEESDENEQNAVKLDQEVSDEDDESGDEEEEEAEDEESGEDEAEIDDSGEEEEDSDEEDSDEEESPPQVTKKQKTPKTTSKDVNLEDLKKNELVSHHQKRYVVFVGNIAYDTNKVDLTQHFQKCGEIKHIRIPTEKKSSKPRGFAYVEVGNEETYQKCLSMHHSFMKGRRINVLYTQGGKKKGEDKKKEIKVKNFKLSAMRKQGQLMGSKKEHQKRSFRRNKQRANDSVQKGHNES